jgi:hypothetical protein
MNHPVFVSDKGKEEANIHQRLNSHDAHHTHTGQRKAVKRPDWD